MKRDVRRSITTAPMPITRRLEIDLYIWNLGNSKARREYRLHPISTIPICEACSRPSRDRYCSRSDCT